MVENSYPKCPICRQESLLPFSTSHPDQTAKVYAHWLCTHCGFYIGTREKRGYNPKDDIKVGNLHGLAELVEQMREHYLTHKTLKEFRV